MQIRSLLIDDNPFNVEVLTDLLRQGHPEVTILGSAHNGRTAVQQIQDLQPDLIFLDVEMPDQNGFEVLASLDRIDFQTIFVTAHSQYAIQAIRFNALDYLVKPINPKELAQALRRYHSTDYARFNRDQVRMAVRNIQQENALDQVLFLPTQTGGTKLALKEVVKIEGERNYSRIHLATGKTELSSKSLGYFEEILVEKGFFRCHRSFLVNRHYVDQLQRDTLILKDATVIPVSRRRKADTKAWFHSL